MAHGKPAHECMGRVIECEANAGFRPGEIVLVRPPQADGLKELVAVTPTDLYHTRGSGVKPDQALMSQLLAPVVHCCKRLGSVRERSVFIIGQGPAGLVLTSMMKLGGAALIATSDLLDSRLRESLRRGADQAVKPGPNLLSKASDLSNGTMFDLVIEAVGDDETIPLAPRLAKERGTVMFFGLPSAEARLTLVDFFSKQLHLTTTEFPDASDFDQAMSMIRKGEIDVASMITHRFPFSQAPAAYQLADERSAGVLRVILSFAG